MSSRGSLKVIHISEDARGGGQFQYIVDIAQDEATDYTVVCPQIDDVVKLKVHGLGIKVHTQDLQILNRKGIWSYVQRFNGEVRALVRTLKELNPDVVVCHGAIQVKGVVAAHKAKIQSVWVMHDSYLGSVSRILFLSLIHISEPTRPY